MGELPHEVIYQVEFPERPGALKKFLSMLQPQWNITLFHYRRSGDHDYPVRDGHASNQCCIALSLAGHWLCLNVLAPGLLSFCLHRHKCKCGCVQQHLSL